MRHLYLLPLLCASCSFDSPPPPTVYTYGSTHHFVVQKQGEPCFEKLTLTIGESYASRISTKDGFTLILGEIEGPTGSWQSIHCVSGDTSSITDEIVTDKNAEFNIHFPETELLKLADFTPSLYFDRTMKPGYKKQSRYKSINGMNSIKVDDKEIARSYLGTTSLLLPDTTYTSVHQLQAQLKSHHGTVRETYYFHDTLGFVYSHITLPDNSIITVTRLGESKKKPQT